MVETPRVAVIVVTYNRRDQLVECIQALLAQTAGCDIIIVDNASTDDTKACLEELGYLDHRQVFYLGLQENLGGTGGFYHGLEYAMGGSWQWFWMMDDDALPDKNALQGLLSQKLSPHNIYGSCAIGIDSDNGEFCFPVRTPNRGERQFVEYHHLLNDMETVVWLPFLGFFIHRELVARIGLPDREFFILDDDVEYSERAKADGAEIILVKNSVIHHPIQRPTLYYFFGLKIYYRSMPPWKIYYDARNKILIAKRYYPLALWTKTLPGILFRAFFSTFHESEKLAPLRAYLAAIKDGLLNNTGKTILPPESG